MVTALLASLDISIRGFEPIGHFARTELEGGNGFVGWVACLLVIAVGLILAMRRVLRRQGESVQPTWLDAPRRRQRLAPIALGTASLPQIVLKRPASSVAPAPPRQSKGDENHGQRTVRVHVLGPLTISGAHQERRGIRAAALELVAYLAFHRNGCNRDELLEALWPNGDPKKTRHRLYQATRDARRLLGDEAIATEHDHYTLDRRHVEVDLDDFEDRLRGLPQGTPVDYEPERLQDALDLFSGEPLAGSDYPWAVAQVQRLRLIKTDLWTELAETQIARGESRAALEASVRGLQGDPLNERLWRTALSAEGALGMRDAVERRYEELRQLLDERLGLEPSSETRSLYRQLLGQM